MSTESRVWFSTRQAGEYVGRHPETVAKACASGELHGSQRKAGASWRIHRDCLDAWIGGGKCQHQIAGAA